MIIMNPSPKKTLMIIMKPQSKENSYDYSETPVQSKLMIIMKPQSNESPLARAQQSVSQVVRRLRVIRLKAFKVV
jgi:hypothetical protein